MYRILVFTLSLPLSEVLREPEMRDKSWRERLDCIANISTAPYLVIAANMSLDRRSPGPATTASEPLKNPRHLPAQTPATQQGVPSFLSRQAHERKPADEARRPRRLLEN